VERLRDPGSAARDTGVEAARPHERRAPGRPARRPDMLRTPGEVLRLQRSAGNRAVAQALSLQRRGPTPVQRFAFDNPDLNLTRSVFLHGSGMFGVAIFKDGTSNPLVVKASTESVHDTILAGVFHEKVTAKKGGVSTVPIRAANPGERAAIAQRVNDQSLVPPSRFEEIAQKSDRYPADPNSRPRFVERMRKAMLDGYQDPRCNVFIQGYASGQDFKDIAGSTTRRNNLTTLLSNRSYAKRMGRVHAADMFLGNSDRFSVMNLGNWMTSLGGVDNAITLIDNFDPTGNQVLNADRQVVWRAENLPKLVDSRATAEERISGGEKNLLEALRAADVDVDQLYPNRQKLDQVVAGLINGFSSGMKEGIDLTLSKLAPRIGRASRTLKAATTARGGDEGATAWRLLKERAQLVRKSRR
jgi:hypothetical protein